MPPAPRQFQVDQIRCPYEVATRLPDAGIEVAVVLAERKVPEDWRNVRWIQPLHADGSSCDTKCGCVTRENRTTIRRGETITIGDWTWHGGEASLLVGYRRIGPSDAEQALQKRLARLKEDLNLEAGYRYLAEEEVAALTRKTTTMRASLRKTWRECRLRGRFATALLWAAAAGWTVAIGLVLTLIGVNA
jgi:hypothetical protein